jgi:hypothetical protein
MFKAVNTNQNQLSVERSSPVSYSSYSSVMPASIGAGDFKTALAQLFFKTNEILKNYADPAISTLTLDGFGPLQKNTPAAQLAVGVTMNLIEARLNTLLSGLEFTLKTLPSKADSLWG